MTTNPTRRRVLAGLAVTTGSVAAGGALPRPVRASRCDEADELESELAEKRATLDSMRATIEGGTDLVKARTVRIMEIVAESQDHQFGTDVRRRAHELGQQVRESVMMLDLTYEHGAAHATGWFHEDGHIITNAHNVDASFDDSTGFMYDGRNFEFEVLGYDEDRSPDVAVLGTEFEAPGLSIGDSTTLSKGDPLVMVGHPGGFGNWVISLGRYDHRSQYVDSVDALNSTVPILSGNSGSPMLTLDGEVVGLLNSSSSKGEQNLRPDGTPKPSPLEVQTTLLTEDSWASAVPIEEAMERTEVWL